MKRKEVIIKAENCCERCGLQFVGKDKLLRQIHHINRNRKDDRLENKELICFYCHWAEHNFKDEMLDWAIERGIL